MHIPAKPIMDPTDKSNSPPIINMAAPIAIIPRLDDTSKKLSVPQALNIPLSPAIIPKKMKTNMDPPNAPSSGLFNNFFNLETLLSLSSWDFLSIL